MSVESNGIRKPAADEVLLITSGDLRLSANQVCWDAQRDMEQALTGAFAQKGIKLIRLMHTTRRSSMASSLRSAWGWMYS